MAKSSNHLLMRLYIINHAVHAMLVTRNRIICVHMYSIFVYSICTVIRLYTVAPLGIYEPIYL